MSAELRAALERLISRAEDAATCPYGGHLSGCNHRPDVEAAAAEARAALEALTRRLSKADTEDGDG